MQNKFFLLLKLSSTTKLTIPEKCIWCSFPIHCFNFSFQCLKIFFPFTFFGTLKVISGRQLVFQAILCIRKRILSRILKEGMGSNNTKYYSSTSRRKREPQCIMKLPRISSIQNSFLYTEVIHYCIIIRSGNRTPYLILSCLYTTFSSQKYFDIWKGPSTV